MQNESTDRRRAIAYLRVSTGLQAREGLGLDVQRDKVHEAAAEAGLELVDVVEEAASGGVRDDEVFSWEHRPVLLSLLDRAEAGEYDVLLVAKLDRLSRDHATLIVLERRLQRLGVEVVSASEASNGDGPIAEFIRGQLALVAQLERQLIRERLSAGKAKAKTLGRHVHGRAPYGYRSEHGVLEVDDELVPVVKLIYAEAGEGRTPGRIARQLNKAGVATPQGGRSWTEQGVRVILTNPAYCGERHGVRNAHPAIVSKRSWNVVQCQLAARRRTP
ncbi:MAG: recombinase family protein [Gaiellales bacterium]